MDCILRLQNNGSGVSNTFQSCGDGDLQELLKETIELSESDSRELEVYLKESGVYLPPSPAERPKADLEDIPAGAKFYDQEIGAKLSLDTAAGLAACSQAMGMAIREDIAMMFGQMHVKKAQLGLKALRLNKEKGWLIPPPLHLAVPEKD